MTISGKDLKTELTGFKDLNLDVSDELIDLLSIGLTKDQRNKKMI